MKSEEVEDLFEKKGFSNRVKLINSKDLEFEISEENSVKIANTIRDLNYCFDGKKKIFVKSALDLSKSNNSGLDLSYCIFEKQVSINNSNHEYEMYLINCEFRQGVNFSKAIFKNNVRFHNSKFYGKTDFTNTSFKKLVDFYFAEFIEDQQFHLTDFEGTTIFSNTTFHKSIQFLHNKVVPNSYISFENAIFHNGLDISRSNFWCTIQFWGVNFDKTQLNKLQESNLYQNDLLTVSGSQSNVSALKRVRETFRLIKHEFRKQGNNINAQLFHRLEMKVYSEEIKVDTGRLGEKILLLMNGISNKHGQSWSRALGFTLGVTVIAYCIFLLTIRDSIVFAQSWEDVGYTMKYFLQLLNLTYWDYMPFGEPNEPEGYLILFISRLFIGYGYYQFIQSFRKYGKN
ncbi:pentapeptide repeat-containing protein [Reichenbachiella agarivorans]|uniref:Pentapeptide repeat-containing protein n=1 Tax=Reichenbachiella agarivorans TaxID=2979464 RepID=A0ABY6CL82_9BACT|nr:pentapeptide repeat-containing protein [Reichenbachiella agarivorans]UXP31271.1 pentapeptide repeat-containing protein [Reichenbachiella agarivorans]